MFGVKAANVAELGTLGFAEGTVPDGFAIPFYFYDEFMKANGLYSEINTMLADTDFQTDFDVQDEMLDDLRDAIKDATTPPTGPFHSWKFQETPFVVSLSNHQWAALRQAQGER